MKRKSIGIYLVELLIVITGVTIAFWLNTRAELRKERQIKQVYYEEFRSDLAKDQRQLQVCAETNRAKLRQMERALRLYRQSPVPRDSVAHYAMAVGNYNFFTPYDFTYRSMINSGDFKLIDDLSIKRQLVAVYSRYELIEELQSNHLQALDQNFFPHLVEQMDYVTGAPIKPIEESMLVKNYFAYSINDLNTHLWLYESTLDLSERLDSLLSEKLHPAPSLEEAP